MEIFLREFVRTLFKSHATMFPFFSVGSGTFGVVSRGTWKRTPVAVKKFKAFVIEEDIDSVRKEMTWLR